MRIGLFGGSFDPPHTGHQALAQAGVETAGFDEVWVIPAHPVHKQLSGCADRALRLHWLQQIFVDSAQIRVIDWEINLPAPSPTIETLRRFRREHPDDEPWLMLGADAWHGLTAWREYPAHIPLCNVAVFARQGEPAPTSHSGWREVTTAQAKENGCWCRIQALLPDISATSLRRDAAAGITLQGRVPEIIRSSVEMAYKSEPPEQQELLRQNKGEHESMAKDQETLEELTTAVVEALEDKKASDLLVIDVRGRCDFTDRFVLASGRSDRQLKALAQSVSEVAHRYTLPAKIEGLDAAEWLLIDLGDLVVHLFLPEVRESFQLERLWAAPAGAKAAL